MHVTPAPQSNVSGTPAFPCERQTIRGVSEVFMAPASEIPEEASSPLSPQAEIRVPTAGTWVGLAAGLLVVAAGFVWTIL
jgi:hypothetical protein